MCQVHTGAYISLLPLAKIYYTSCHSRKTTTYIVHVVPLDRHAHVKRMPNATKKRNKENMIKKEVEITENKEKKEMKEKRRIR